MITLLIGENNPLTPSFYNDLINNLQFHQLSCTCGHAGCLFVHGYYNRSVKLPEGKTTFRICRVRCVVCGHTHAILLSSMVPYSQVSVSDHVSIINNYCKHSSQDAVMNANPCIDESIYRYIVRCYLRYWHQRLLSERIPLGSVSLLIQSCFEHFSRQFMQIKNTPNVLFLNTT